MPGGTGFLSGCEGLCHLAGASLARRGGLLLGFLGAVHPDLLDECLDAQPQSTQFVAAAASDDPEAAVVVERSSTEHFDAHDRVLAGEHVGYLLDLVVACAVDVPHELLEPGLPHRETVVPRNVHSTFFQLRADSK